MPESLCECGHFKSDHPNVGRRTTWPTACIYCECRGYRSETLTDSEAMRLMALLRLAVSE